MKILSITHSPNYSSNSNSKPNYIRHSSAGDTFERTTNFKGRVPKSIQDTAMQILKNPNKILSGAGFAAAFYAALEALANGKEIFGNDAAQVAAEKFIEAEAQQAQENNEVVKQIESKDIAPQQVHEEITTKNSIELPRRHGTLSPNEKALRATVAEIEGLSDESQKQLLEIWNQIMSKGLSDEERKTIDKKKLAELKAKYNEIAISLNEKLISSQNKQEVINEFYIKLFQPQADKIEEVPSYKSEVPELPGFKTVGFISPEELTRMEGGKQKARIKGSEGLSSAGANGEVKVLDSQSQLWGYTAKGTLSDSFEENLSILWREFKKMCITQTSKEENKSPVEIHIAWSKGYNIGKDTTLAYVKKELERHEYKRINEKNAGVIAGVINGNEILRECFSLHAAMRFIDRFIDFKSEVSLRDQVQKGLDMLIGTIEKALKNELQLYKYEDPNGYVNADLVVEMKNADIEAQHLLGTSDIILGVGERYRKKGDDDNAKHAVIKTIF